MVSMVCCYGVLVGGQGARVGLLRQCGGGDGANGGGSSCDKRGIVGREDGGVWDVRCGVWVVESGGGCAPMLAKPHMVPVRTYER